MGIRQAINNNQGSYSLLHSQLKLLDIDFPVQTLLTSLKKHINDINKLIITLIVHWLFFVLRRAIADIKEL